MHKCFILFSGFKKKSKKEKKKKKKKKNPKENPIVKMAANYAKAIRVSSWDAGF